MVDGSLQPQQIEYVVAASAEGYSFPTNLDSDPPVNGMAPQTQSQLVHSCLQNRVSAEQFEVLLCEHANRRLSVQPTLQN